MTEKELINKIRRLREIKPNNDWAVLVKQRILEEKIEPVIAKESYHTQAPAAANTVQARIGIKEITNWLGIIFYRKFVLASAVSVLILFGLFVSAQNSLPGSAFFPLKKAVENGKAAFVPQKERSNYDFEMAQKRLEELKKIAQKNSVKNLAPAINEYQESVSKIADNLSKAKNRKEVKDILVKVQELKSKESGIKSLGSVVIPDNKKLEISYAQKLLETLKPVIKDLKSSTLTEGQKKALADVEKDLADKNYEGALMKLLSPPLNIGGR